MTETEILASRPKKPDDPSVQVLREIMHAVRRKSSNDVDMKGKLAIALSMTGMDAAGMFQMVAHVILNAQGKAYDVNISRWETEYTGINISGAGSEWNIVLRPGGLYRIVGAQKDGVIEATLL